MSQPSTDAAGQLPERAAFPIQHLPRYHLTNQNRKLSSEIGLALSQRAAVNADGAGGSSSRVSKPAPAVIRSGDGNADRNTEYIASIERGPFSNHVSDTGTSNVKVKKFRMERRERNPYEPTTLDKITESFNTVPYIAKISIYRTLIILWNLPENIVRAKRRIFSPPPKPQTLPDPATTIINTQWPKPPGIGRRILIWLFEKSRLQFYGFLFTLALNGAFAFWVWVHVSVYLDPHTWRLRRLVTSSSTAWTSFTSLEIWVAIMLGVWNIAGAYLILAGFVLLVEWTKILFKWIWAGLTRKRIPPQRAENTAPKEKLGPWMTTLFFLYFVILLLWPILASTIPAPRSRVNRYPKRCGGGTWDFRVIVDGRVEPKNLTKGRVTIREMKGGNAGREVVYITDDHVNATWMRTDDMVVLRRATTPAEGETLYVNEVVYRFPYLQTEWEKAGWNSLPDVQRERGGNYTVVLTNSETGANETVNGRFPYLDDGSGLRLDEMGLIPDVKRSWRAIASATESCPWGPDAKLLENTDVTARDIAGEGYPVLLTDMTRFGKCSELTVCANRRRQVVDGLPWAVGEAGKNVLDAMLVVPLGLILMEQIRYGSCCGDGFEPFKAGA
ncbi:hypothetical protein TWF718_001730 [Orbilia javanica]|uniref:Uncharacterized protein n=1 Tax=Orbilia javanica TaxID=47235 RepID=A0AAN8RNM3_9PEZI